MRLVSIPGLLTALLIVLSGCGGGDSGSSTSDAGGVVAEVASTARGGLLYDQWWTVNGQSEPAGEHPLYSESLGTQVGSTTWRCVECHGWDYRGKDGAYRSGSHYSAIGGVYDYARTGGEPQIIASLNGLAASGAGHDFSNLLSAEDILDLSRFLTRGLVDMEPLIHPTTLDASGDVVSGQSLYRKQGLCSACHGTYGDRFLEGRGETLSERANAEPWRALHRIRWGHPGTAMASGVAEGLSDAENNDLLAYLQSLPSAAGIEASAARGGLLYDNWWKVNGAAAPTSTHSLYLQFSGSKSGGTTWRCKECHGWDYRGRDGAYGSGSHYSGIAGVFGFASTADEAQLSASLSGQGPSGVEHDFTGVLSAADILDLARFQSRQLLDMDLFIDPVSKQANGDPVAGEQLYRGQGWCSSCHGADGALFWIGGSDTLSQVANGNPWETLHKIRWGHPGSSMPSGDYDNALSTDQANDILAYGQSLPLSSAPPAAGPALFINNCVPCHTGNGLGIPTPMPADKTGRSAARIQEALDAQIPGMDAVSVNSTEVQAISDALAP